MHWPLWPPAWAPWAVAGVWGLVGGLALVVGAAVAFLLRLPPRLTAGIMAFGCGVLFSAVAYDLILEGFEASALAPVAGGAVAGSVAYAVANHLVSARGRHRKRSGAAKQDASAAGGLAIAVGSLLDGIPESVVLGIGVVSGGGVSLALLAAIVLSNFPEGLSSATGMRAAGRGPRYVFGVWGGIAVASGLAAALGAGLLGGASPAVVATVNAVAAGALLTMIADTMIPEAVEVEGGATGLLVVLGLLAAFGLSHWGAGAGGGPGAPGEVAGP